MKSCKVLICFFLILSIGNISCKKDWFDVKSDRSLTVPSTLDDLEYLLDDFIIMNTQTPSVAEAGSDGHFMPESQWASNNISPAERNAYTWTRERQNIKITDWNESYSKIFHCNLVLDRLNKIKPANASEQEQYNRVKGNALFHRAKNYYDLAQVYAQPYKPASAARDLGIPLKEGIDITEKATRASVKQTYDQVLQDLHTAYPLLPAIPSVLTRGSRSACFALMSRTYLTMADYPKAGIYADSSLRIVNTLIDYNTISANNNNFSRFNAETIFFSRGNNSWLSVVLAGYCFVDPDLYNLYHENDLRKTRFFKFSGTNIVFKGSYSASILLFTGLAIDEQYLIRAECHARAGSTTEAMKYLNDLLRTRWSKEPGVVYPESTATDAEDALRQILEERRKELLFRNLRWTDLRRLNLDERFKTSLSRTIGGTTYTLEPDSYNYTLPIPDDVIAFSQMQQSPGW